MGLTVSEKLRAKFVSTSLPDWIITGIRQIAWTEFHSNGQDEVDMYVLDWIEQFEGLKQNHDKPSVEFKMGKHSHV